MGSHVLWTSSEYSSHCHSGWEAESLSRCQAIMGDLLPVPAVSCPMQTFCAGSCSAKCPVFFLPEGLLGFLVRTPPT